MIAAKDSMQLPMNLISMYTYNTVKNMYINISNIYLLHICIYKKCNIFDVLEYKHS